MYKSRNYMDNVTVGTLNDEAMAAIVQKFLESDDILKATSATGYLPLFSGTTNLRNWMHEHPIGAVHDGLHGWCEVHTVPCTLIVMGCDFSLGGYSTEIWERQHPAQGGEWKQTTHYFIQAKGEANLDAIGAYVGDFRHQHTRSAELVQSIKDYEKMKRNTEKKKSRY